MRGPLELARKAIRSPDEIAPYLNRRYAGVKCSILYRNFRTLRERIHEFIQHKKFALVILDAARYDYFEEEVANYLQGEIERIYTPYTATVEFMENVWTEQYDLAYITGASTQADHTYERKGLDYRPSEHISTIVHAWNTCEEKELGATPPEYLTELALRRMDERIVIHYNQPHAPYIGEYRLRAVDKDIGHGESQRDIYTKIGRYDSAEKTIPDSELRKAYRSNLQRALESVRHLVSQLDRPVVVTADHGEMLGESGRYIHGGAQHPHLCELPWFTVDESMLGEESAGGAERESYQTGDFNEQDVVKQLENLGYM